MGYYQKLNNGLGSTNHSGRRGERRINRNKSLPAFVIGKHSAKFRTGGERSNNPVYMSGAYSNLKIRNDFDSQNWKMSLTPLNLNKTRSSKKYTHSLRSSGRNPLMKKTFKGSVKVDRNIFGPRNTRKTRKIALENDFSSFKSKFQGINHSQFSRTHDVGFGISSAKRELNFTGRSNSRANFTDRVVENSSKIHDQEMSSAARIQSDNRGSGSLSMRLTGKSLNFRKSKPGAGKKGKINILVSPKALKGVSAKSYVSSGSPCRI